MSETNFVVSPELLRETAGTYGKELVTVLRALEHYAKAISKLSSDYTGIAAMTMIPKIITLTRNLGATSVRIVETMKELNLSADIYEEVEKANESLMQSLNVGV